MCTALYRARCLVTWSVLTSVVVLEESPCPQGSLRTNLQVLVLILGPQSPCPWTTSPYPQTTSQQHKSWKHAIKPIRALGMYNRTIKYKSKSVTLGLYKTLVRPHLEYCTPAWSPHYVKDKHMLEKVQHRGLQGWSPAWKNYHMKSDYNSWVSGH